MDLTELGIDSIMEEGILSELPIAKTVLAFCKTGLAIKERNLMKQTIAFISGFNSNSISEEKKEKYRQKLCLDSQYAEEELGRVLILLDANVDSIKSVMLGRVYSSYVNGDMEWDRFCEYSEVVRRMFVSDFKLLENSFRNNANISNADKYKIGRLIALGLVVESDSPAASKDSINEFYSRLRTGNSISADALSVLTHNEYQMTALGKGLMHIIHQKK